MRSKTAKQILSETPEKVRDKVRKYGDHVVCRDFKLLVRRYFNAKDVAANPYNPLVATEAALMEAETEKQIRKELERFTEQEQKELPFNE